MTALREAAQQALEALEEIADEVFSPYDNKLGDAILALRAALAQQAEPLTEEQIIDATEHIDTSRNGYFIDIARAVERAHGIE